MPIAFGPYRFDQASEKLEKHGTGVRLGGMPLKILQSLLSEPGKLVSRDDLCQALWNGARFGNFEQGLNSAVNVLRKTLNDSADQPRYIETVAGQGYRFIAPVSMEAVMVAEEKAEELVEARPAGSTRRFVWGIAAIVVAALVFFWWLSKSRPEPKLIYGSKPSTNRLANDQYELGMNFLAVQNDLQAARKAFRHALDFDPDFAAARLQYATNPILEILNGISNDESQIYRAEEELHKAEKTTPRSDGLLLAAQAGIYLSEGRLDLVPFAEIERQWHSSPDNPAWLVVLLMLRDRSGEALTILQKWMVGKPLDNVNRMFMAEALRMRGDTAGAIELLERTLQQAPGHMTPMWFLTMAYLDAGKPQRADALLEGMKARFEQNYMWRHARAITFAAEGKAEEARTAMDEETLKFARLTWSVTSATAGFYAILGDRAKAIEWLRLAIARGDERLSYFRRDPRLAGLRDDLQFQALLRTVEARRR